jgi:hypothetical protein
MLLAFARYFVMAPWRLHEQQAARIREFERRPDVGRLAERRKRGVQVLSDDE